MDERATDIQELSGKTPEFRTQLAKQLEDLVPEAIADGKVDVAKLKELLDEDAGDTNERFGLFWPGKKRAMRAAQDPTTATLKPAKELSKDWDTTENIFIEGDNLEVLKVLQKQYHNSIKMIYIDPPYNTGKDFVYPDNFKEGLQNYLEFSKQVDAGGKKINTNAETQGRYHSNWLNMMYPRLKLARNLLTDDGVIFISIDDAEQANLKKVCDEIYGESNFVASVVWRKKKAYGAGDRFFIPQTEYILVYARNTEKLPNFGSEILSDKIASRYKFVDEKKGKYELLPLWRKVVTGTYYRPTLQYDLELDGKKIDSVSGQFLRTKDRILRDYSNGDIKIVEMNGKHRIYYKSYLNFDANGNPRSSTPLSYFEESTTSDGAKECARTLDGKYFDFPKPTGLINYFLKHYPAKNGLILDFFSGSGTTAHAVMQLNAEDGGNRKHIQVQLPEPTDEKSEAYKAGYRKISDIARERINRAGEKIKTEYADKLAERDTPLDIGYRTYKLSDTNFTKWRSEATNDLGELQMRLDAMRSSSEDNASEEDLLVEVMLKLGLPLTSRTIEREVSGLTVHQVVASADLDDSETQPVFYLNEHVKPTLEQLRAIVTELTPSRFVILDDAFQGDSQLKTNLVQTCKSYDVELWTV